MNRAEKVCATVGGLTGAALGVFLVSRGILVPEWMERRMAEMTASDWTVGILRAFSLLCTLATLGILSVVLWRMNHRNNLEESA